MPEMKVTVAPSGLIEAEDSEMGVRAFGVILFSLSFLWLEIINQLRSEWSFNPQYSYGWSVPFLALYLIWKRWPTRPPAAVPRSRVLPLAIIGFCALLYFPLRFVAEANPDWRLLSWTQAIVAVAISLSLIYLAGGIPSLRYFAFPFLFFLVAVPWPTQLEQL